MAWQRIDDNAKAWELLQAGLLWHGHPPTDMICYDRGWESWDQVDWMSTHFGGAGGHRPNYILIEE